MAKVELKQPIVEAISEELKGAQSVVLVDYRGLTVAQDTELRKKLREAGVTSVSYTHLDVYKRQRVHASSQRRLQIAPQTAGNGFSVLISFNASR